MTPETVPASSPDDVSLSFAGCGFLGFYHVGVIGCFEKHVPSVLLRGRMAGSSAGAVVACSVVNGFMVERCAEALLEVIGETESLALGSLSPSFSLDASIRKLLEKLLPADAHVRSSGRLFVSMTRFPDFRDVVVSEFETREELIEAILCSCYIPVYSGFSLPGYRGRLYFDGALSNNVPAIDPGTVVVSPFAGRTGICPRGDDESGPFSTDYCLDVGRMSTRASLKNALRFGRILFPLDLERNEQLCREGFADALAFLRGHGLVEDEPRPGGNQPLTAADPLPAVSKVFAEAIRRRDEESAVRARALRRRESLWPFLLLFSCACFACGKFASWFPRALVEVRSFFETLLDFFFDALESLKTSILPLVRSWRGALAEVAVGLGRRLGLRRLTGEGPRLYSLVFFDRD